MIEWSIEALSEVILSENNDSASTELRSQEKLLILISVFSVGFHFLFVVLINSGLTTSPEPLVREWVLESELIIENDLSDADRSSLPKAESEGPLLVPSNLLPQLPKQYEIEKQEVKKKIGKSQEQNKKKSGEENRSGSEDSLKKEDLVKKLEEQEVLKRKALENLAKLQKQKSDKYQAPQKEALLKLKKELDSLDQTAIKGGNVLGDSLEHRQWKNQLERSVRSHYFLPKTFRAMSKDMATILAIKVNSRGDILDLSIYESSADPVFDALAISTTKKAAPFVNPPKGLAGKTIHFRFVP